MEINKLGHLGGWLCGRNVYDSDGIAPTICAGMGEGDGIVPMIVELQQIDIPQTVTFRKYPVEIERLQTLLRQQKQKLGISTKEVAERLGIPITKAEHWFRLDSGFAIPDPNIWKQLSEILQIDDADLTTQITTFAEQVGTFEKSERHYLDSGLAPTLMAGNNDKIIVAMRGRNPNSPTSRKRQTPEHKFEQQLEVQQDGLCNTLSTVQKDNMVLEPITTNGQKRDIANTILSGYERTNMTGFNNDNAVLVGGIGEMKSNGGTQYYQQDRVYDSNSIAVAHQAQLAGGSYKYMVENNAQYRIRKLTPKECFRLMGVRDEDYDKLTVSNSQKYKQAGNSIVVDVMMAIFENMFINECESNSLF